MKVKTNAQIFFIIKNDSVVQSFAFVLHVITVMNGIKVPR